MLQNNEVILRAGDIVDRIIEIMCGQQDKT